jgi:hypothetical protein
MELLSREYALWPDRAALRELVRPWKMASFVTAMALLLYGALNFNIGDWDVGVTLLMGTLTYVFAPWSVLVIGSAVRYRPRGWWAHVALSIIVAVLIVDTAYITYSHIVGNRTDRLGNFYASMPLYFLAGMCWLYRGSLKELMTEVRRAIAALQL